jgi:hypothetical protein
MVMVDQVQVEEVSREEGCRILDDAARRWLDMSAEEFIDAWDAGKFADRADTPEVINVAMLIPFAK